MENVIEKRNGCLIVLEGLDGAGKTTAVKYLKEKFESLGYEVVATREPGGSPYAEALRDIMKGEISNDTDALTQTMLVCSARRDHVQKTIRPALEAGKVVICDRYILSTFAYQGISEKIVNLCELGMDNLVPDVTLMMLLSVEESIKRTRARNGDESLVADRFETEDIIKLAERSERYEEASMHSRYVGVRYDIDANQDIYGVQCQLGQFVRGSAIDFLNGNTDAFRMR